MSNLARVQLDRIQHCATPIPPELAATVLSQAMNELARDMFGLACQMHELGFIMIDNKAENLVFSRSAGGYQLIDGELVQRCALGKQIMGERLMRCTPHYAAPEQRARLWADSRSDVYTCGRSLEWVVERCLFQSYRDALRVRSQYVEAISPLVIALRPLVDLAKCCTAKDPAKRPTAAEAFDLLERYMS
ncbi:hypothetical protein PLESTB_000018400 [Pleodorina starrii]|uniref:Protein kinase domain-containing protein n=1 Tax=Pleodorina starrii TaxID=330485 RepID=A0A9W6B8F9_9CHLO|nr:hypothetical protein PLESTM_001116200 [Pleodorina starrii]GLC47718.1 hypothetical protein PLESTB_000018400 [Pleodorina starrii]GLC70870.1 hypothetical protein PLESTF_001041800 [Pleodorina starrii]